MNSIDQFSLCFPLRAGRTHEVDGAGKVAFAVALAKQVNGSSLWISESWLNETLNPWGVSEFCDPRQMLFATCDSQTDVLAVAEEALRFGAVKLVVYSLTAPLSLTAGRRLQLAANAGKSTGVALIQEGMGSNATQTRWHCAPVFNEMDSTLQKWEIIKNKSGTLGYWHVRWNTSSRSIAVVSPSVYRSGS